MLTRQPPAAVGRGAAGGEQGNGSVRGWGGCRNAEGEAGLLLYAAVRWGGERDGGAAGGMGPRDWSGGTAERWQDRVPRSCQGSGVRAWGPARPFLACICSMHILAPWDASFPFPPGAPSHGRMAFPPSFSSSESRPLCGSQISPRFVVLLLLSSSNEVEGIMAC